jgi:hypothetical protein
MHTLDCLISIGGDVANRHYKTGITVPEFQVLQFIHGEGMLSEIKITGNPRVNQLEERDRLSQAYPKFGNVVVGFWRDNGGRFISDVRELGLSPQLFAAKREAPYEDADRMEEEEVEAEKSAKAPKKRKSRAKAKVELQADPPVIPPSDLGEGLAASGAIV